MPAAQAREGFDAWLRQEATKVVGGKTDVPTSFDDLLNFGRLLCASSELDRQEKNQISRMKSFFCDDGAAGLQYLLQLVASPSLCSSLNPKP